MIYIFRRQYSEGASDLADALNDANIPARFTQGGLINGSERVRQRLADGRDKLICWGSEAHWIALHTLNAAPLTSKFSDAIKLREANVSTVEVSRSRPPARPASRRQFEGQAVVPAGGWWSEAEVREIMARMQAYLQEPLPPAVEWLPRSNNHIGGRDLLTPLSRPDYWVKRENIVEEYRLHIFNGKSIRAGKKIRREYRPDGTTPSHEWIRSFDAGWIISYEGFQSRKEMREMSVSAVEALGLDFGAVDLARREDNSLMVLEVNRAPGIEGGSLDAYVSAIGKWNRGEE